jgi:hypothetical protein
VWLKPNKYVGEIRYKSGNVSKEDKHAVGPNVTFDFITHHTPSSSLLPRIPKHRRAFYSSSSHIRMEGSLLILRCLVDLITELIKIYGPTILQTSK